MIKLFFDLTFYVSKLIIRVVMALIKSVVTAIVHFFKNKRAVIKETTKPVVVFGELKRMAR